jgi:hypothetical protein
MACERGIKGIKAFFLAGSGLFSQEYWQAILKPYKSFTFERGLSEMERVAPL